MEATSNKLTYLDEVICYYIKAVGYYSTFLSETLFDNWMKYKDSRKNTYLDSIKKKLTKLERLERKKEMSIEKYDYDSRVSLSFYNNLNKEISSSISSSLLYMIKYYDRISNKNDYLPKRKINNKTSISYILLEDGYYAHLRYEKKKLVINKSSFKNEIIIFKSSLNDDYMKWDDEVNPISTCEKRRRKIIDDSFSLYKKIMSLKNSSVDENYNISSVYEICKLIIDDLYDSLVSNNKEYDVFKKLMNMTKEQYELSKYLTDYDLVYMNFKKNIDILDNSTKDSFFSISNELKKKSPYIEFKIVDGIIPSVFDLFNILNNRIINNVLINMRDLKERLSIVTTYMTIDEMVRYYKRLIEVKNDVKYSIKCQKCFVKLMEERFGVFEDTILSEYLKDEKLY